MAFPDNDLELLAEAAFGADLTADPATWSWTDLTSRLQPIPVSIRRGVSVGAAASQTSFATVTLNNEDGALTPLRAGSPYWPYVDSGTPMRLRLRTERAITDSFTRTVSNGWGTADSGDLWEPLAGSESAYSVTGGQARTSIAAVNTSRSIRMFRPIRDVEVLFDVAAAAVQTGGASSAGPWLRRTGGGLISLWTTVEFGLGGAINLRVRRYPNSASAITLANVAVAGLTYSAGTMIRCRVRCVGERLQMRAWLASGTEPATWTVDITQSDVLEAGESIAFQVSVPSTNTNTMPAVFSVDNLSVTQVPYARLEGYIADVRPTFQPSGGGTTWSQVQVDIAGIGSRLEKNQAPAWSPMRRSVQLAQTPPIAYWPLEDPEGSTFGAPAFPGQAKMTVTGPAVFGFASGVPDEQYLSRYGTLPLVSVAAGARLQANVEPSNSTSEWAVTVTAQLYAPDVPGAGQIPIIEWLTPGLSWDRWRLIATTTGYIVRAYDTPTSSSADVITTTSGAFSQQVAFEVDAVQSGGNINVILYVNSGTYASGSVAGTMAAVTRVVVNPERWNTTAALTPNGLRFIVGHVRVADDTDGSGVPYYYDAEQGMVLVRADQAWYREAAHRRIARLCEEERVPCEILGDPYLTGITRLNAQQDGSFTELLEAAAEAESGGLLYEAAFGYRYLPRSARYNQPVALTVDLATYQHSGDTDPTDVLVPQLDPRTTNYWTVRRTDGSTGTAAADEAYRQRRGTIAEQVDIDLLYDTDLDDHAAWRVHLGVDAADAYYPDLPLDLAANPGLIQAWLDCDLGSRVQRTNQPTVAGHNIIDQVIEGVTETVGPRTWTATLNCSPGAVWDVWTPGDPVLGWINFPDDTTIPAQLAAGSTTVLIAVPNMTTDPAAYPVDINIGGERITLTGPPTGSSVKTFTGCVRAVNGVSKNHAAGSAVTLWTRPFLAL